MAAGLPIVAGNIGPISELVDDGVEARFWPLDSPAQAAAVLLDLLDSEPKRALAASAATARFHRDFDADVIAPRLLSFLQGETADVHSRGSVRAQPAADVAGGSWTSAELPA